MSKIINFIKTKKLSSILLASTLVLCTPSLAMAEENDLVSEEQTVETNPNQQTKESICPECGNVITSKATVVESGFEGDYTIDNHYTSYEKAAEVRQVVSEEQENIKKTQENMGNDYNYNVQIEEQTMVQPFYQDGFKSEEEILRFIESMKETNPNIKLDYEILSAIEVNLIDEYFKTEKEAEAYINALTADGYIISKKVITVDDKEDENKQYHLEAEAEKKSNSYEINGNITITTYVIKYNIWGTERTIEFVEEPHMCLIKEKDTTPQIEPMDTLLKTIENAEFTQELQSDYQQKPANTLAKTGDNDNLGLLFAGAITAGGVALGSKQLIKRKKRKAVN